MPAPRAVQPIVEHNNETVLGSSRKLGEVAEHLIDGSKNAFDGWALSSRVRMLLKGAVIY